jgi:GNAT superfamily N-acetyltransferase
MQITYSDAKEFTPEVIGELFLSVGWSSGAYPERLAKAMRNYGSVYTAWDEDKLTGLVSTMDDGEMTAYVHYMLVRPEYQGKGIGRELLMLVKERYKNYLRIVLVAYDKELEFYKNCGFTASEESTPMFITSLWT